MGGSVPQEIDLSTETSLACFEVSAAGCPRLRICSGLLPVNGETALGYLELGYWPIPIVQDRDNTWVPAVPWVRRPNAGVALVCGRDAGLLVLHVDPRHGAVDPAAFCTSFGCFATKGRSL